MRAESARVGAARVSHVGRSGAPSRADPSRAVDPSSAFRVPRSVFRVPCSVALCVTDSTAAETGAATFIHSTLYIVQYTLHIIHGTHTVLRMLYTVRTLYSVYVIQCVLYILHTLGMFYEPCTQHIYTTQIIHRITRIIHFTQYILPTLY